METQQNTEEVSAKKSEKPEHGKKLLNPWMIGRYGGSEELVVLMGERGY